MPQSTDEKSSVGKLFVPSLTLAFLSTAIIEALTGVFLLDVTATFFGLPDSVSIATTSQLVTISSVVSVVFGLLLGVLSVRFSHKKLLLFGSLCIVLGTLGCFLAPNFLFMQVFFPIEGIGTVAVIAMAFTLVGESLVLGKRSRAIGWVGAGGALSGLTASVVINLFFSGAGGWRSYLLGFALPISLVAFVFVYFFVSSPRKSTTVGKEAYLNSFKQVFLKKSAVACLIGNMFRQAGLGWGVVYSVTFYRIQFDLSLASGALIALVAFALVASAGVVGGHLVNRFGRRRQVVATLVVSYLLLALIPFIPNLWIVLTINFLSAFIQGLGIPAGTSLVLEQAPESRGTMMSISSIFITFGLGLGAALGGAALVLSGWTGLVLTFCAINLVAAAIFFFLTKDPCRT